MPWSYLKGVSSSGMGEVLRVLLGKQAKALSGDSIMFR